MRIGHASMSPQAGVLAVAVALLAAALAFNPGRADASAARMANPSSVAVVDLAKLLDGMDEREALEADLNKEISARQGELDALLGEITRMTEDIKMLAETDPTRISRIRDLRLKEVQARALKERQEQADDPEMLPRVTLDDVPPDMNR